jgi:RimJ/RimL family protein N-acetyltransferase
MVIKEINGAENFQRTFTDSKGDSCIIRPADENDFESILHMYDLFEPKESSQGLPPADPVRRRELVRKIVDESINIIVEYVSFVAGHACLIEMEPGVRSELEIVIHQDWQARGLGSEMVSLLVELGKHFNYETIWLTVDSSNRKAIQVYQKNGFNFVGPLGSEREMEMKLK